MSLGVHCPQLRHAAYLTLIVHGCDIALMLFALSNEKMWKLTGPLRGGGGSTLNPFLRPGRTPRAALRHGRRHGAEGSARSPTRLQGQPPLHLLDPP